jgi:DNA-binding beta-propeller fold protein YncE
MSLGGVVASDGVIALAFDPTGQFAYTANEVINLYAVDPVTGLFTAVSSTTPAPFEIPDLVAVRPDGKFLYATGNRSALSGFSIASTTGALTPLQGSPFNGGGSSEPTLMALDPSGSFVYVSDCDCRVGWNAPGLLFGSRLDGTTGVAAAVMPPGAPTAILAKVGINPSRLVFEPSGKFAYTSSTDGQTCAGPGIPSGEPQIVSGFAVDASSGILTPLSGNPLTVGSKPTDCTARSPAIIQ